MAILTLEHRRVLVLNKLWAAIGVCSLQRAIGLLFSEYHNGEPKARVIDTVMDFQTFSWSDWAELRPKDGEQCIHAAQGMAFRLPEVLLLTRYDKMPQQRVLFSRRTLYRRDNFCCQYCGIKPGSEELTIDHVIPRSHDGKTTWDNCVLACIQCNSQKANRIPEKAYKGLLSQGLRKNWRGPTPMRLRSVPKKPRYTLFKGNRKTVPQSWNHFISEVYWQVTMDNDEEDED